MPIKEPTQLNLGAFPELKLPWANVITLCKYLSVGLSCAQQTFLAVASGTQETKPSCGLVLSG